MKRIILILSFCMVHIGLWAQYAPQQGVAGSTAISRNSGKFTGWATGCAVVRGLSNIADANSGYVTAGLDISATGAPDNGIVSLGDSGTATLTFAAPIFNGAGPDFAVFENGFQNPANLEEAFMELAFVEVSSDGVSFTRFAPSSVTPLTPQIPGAGVYMNARFVHNLAGKYIGGYGTPFDLSELEGTVGLDINNITHIRLVDVVGSVSSHSQLDKDGNTINDPYPTPFAGGGFDLDAVGAFYQHGLFPTNVNIIAHSPINIYPNPSADKIQLTLPEALSNSYTATLTDISGKVLRSININAITTEMSLAPYVQGVYFIVLADANGNRWTEKIVKI